MQTSCTTATPKRLIDGWHATSSPWLTITSRSIIAQDPLIERMHYLKGQTTMKERRTTVKLPLYPHLCLLNSSILLHWMPKLRLTIRRIKRNTPSYKERTIGKKKQDSRSEKDKSLYYQMRLERNSFENIMIIQWRDIQEQLPLTSPSEESTGGQDSKITSKNTLKDALLASKKVRYPEEEATPVSHQTKTGSQPFRNNRDGLDH